jgi:hypothetical protein
LSSTARGAIVSAYVAALAASIVFVAAGKACAPRFDVSAGIGWLEIYALFTWWLWIPAVMLAGVAAARVRVAVAFNFRIAASAIVVFAVIVTVAAVLTPANGRCVYP